MNTSLWTRQAAITLALLVAAISCQAPVATPRSAADNPYLRAVAAKTTPRLVARNRQTRVVGRASSPAAVMTAPPAPAISPAAQAQPTAARTAAAPAPTTVPVAAAETVKVGLLTGITGAAGRAGLNVERFMRLSIDDINAKGGVKAAGKV